MPLNISFVDLMAECRINDQKEFRDLLKRNKFEVAANYEERVANKIAWRLGQRVDWFKYKSLQRNEAEERPVTIGLSTQVKSLIPQWYAKLVGDKPTEITLDHMIGFVCRGGFLEGRDETEFVMRFDPGINVIIGDRGSGKSTALHLISLLAGSLSEGSNVLIEKLLTLTESAEVEQTEFERRLRKTLTTYGIDVLSSFFCRSGKRYACTITRERNQWNYELLLNANNTWQSVDPSTALLHFPVQFLRQGEIVQISESGDNYYINQIIDSLNDQLYAQRSQLARKLKRFAEQYFQYQERTISYDFRRVEAFVDARNDELYKLRTQIRSPAKRFSEVHPILDRWLSIWRNMSKPRRFQNVLSLLKTDSDDDLYYFLFGPIITSIHDAKYLLYELESRYRNVSVPQPARFTVEAPITDESELYENPNVTTMDQDRVDEIEPLKEMIQDAEFAVVGEDSTRTIDFANLLREFEGIQDKEGEELLGVIRRIHGQLSGRLDLLERIIESYREANIELHGPLDALVKGYIDILQAKVLLVTAQETECKRLTTILNAEDVESRVYTKSFNDILKSYETQIHYLQRLKPLWRQLNSYYFGRRLNDDLNRLRAFADEYRTTIEQFNEQVSQFTASVVDQNNRNYLFDTIEIEMRQGNIYRTFRNLSFGQKSGVILKLVLGSDDDRILVLDQPEDHLDAYSIDRLIVPTIRNLVSRRQVIIATHNSSLVLGLDPALIMVLESIGETGRIRAEGTLSNKDVVRELVSVLEGGIETFNLKIDSYEAFVKRLIGSIEDTDIRLIENSFRRRTIDELRNVLQPVISDRSLLGIMRHQLKHEPLVSQGGETRIGEEIANLRDTLRPGHVRDQGDGSLLEKLDQLVEDLDTDIASFETAVESIRLLDTNPAPTVLNLFECLAAIKGEYLKIPAGKRLRSIQIDEKLKPEHLLVDKNHLNLVFRNLFDNSFRATEIKSVKMRRDNRAVPNMMEEVEIELSMSASDKLELKYCDNGRGIPEAIKGHLYKESVSDQPGQDHGLGGVIIKKLLSLNNAEISILNSSNQGTIQRIIFHRSRDL